ncbi:MAG: 16S rRNA (uracil(1498)-N(3))-methyltransferase [Phycisphaerales bacterium]
MHHVIVPELDADNLDLAIEGEQARHAVRVRRMEPGEPVVLIDGAGGRALAHVTGADKEGPQRSWRLLVRIEDLQRHPRPTPAVHVLCPAPKGDLLETMIDQLSQVGATSWRPLETERSEREPRQGKMDRLARIAEESAKQCGRPWLLEIGPSISFSGALELPGGLIAQAGAPALARVSSDLVSDRRSTGIFVLVGPEGGFSEAERSMASEAGLIGVGLGPHVLRIGTAAVAAASVLVQLATDG